MVMCFFLSADVPQFLKSPQPASNAAVLSESVAFP
jgi:hypothetical protein